MFELSYDGGRLLVDKICYNGQAIKGITALTTEDLCGEQKNRKLHLYMELWPLRVEMADENVTGGLSDAVEKHIRELPPNIILGLANQMLDLATEKALEETQDA